MSIEAAAGALKIGTDVVGKIGADIAGKEIAKRAVAAIAKKENIVEKILRDKFKIEGQEMTILCPEMIQKYSLSLIPKTLPLIPSKMKFPYGAPIRVDIRQVRSLHRMQDAVKIVPNGFEIDLKKLESEELYFLDIEYQIEDHRFIDSLVDRIIPHDTPHNSEDSVIKYEMSAQLKHLDVLKQKNSSVRLRDIDFTVDVAVHQDVKTTVPGLFKQQLETLVEISKKKGRSDLYRLMMRHLHLQAQKYGGKEIEILQNLYELFTPNTFRRFIDVLEDFHYNECRRGTDFYDTLPFPTWPKSMKVVSRTDLNLEKPAADGVLVYKHKDFVSEIEKIFDLIKKTKTTSL